MHFGNMWLIGSGFYQETGASRSIFRYDLKDSWVLLPIGLIFFAASFNSVGQMQPAVVANGG